MRIVVDTNIFVSASLKESSWPSEVVRWIGESGGLLKSVVTEAQVFEVLRRPYFAPRLSPSFFSGVHRIFAAAEMVEITERVAACRDPTDDKFLELAVNGRADVIITGDLDLLVLNPFRGIPIVTPRVFIHERQREA
jgi:putative PIN family toxin of toxin-antitoxin system